MYQRMKTNKIPFILMKLICKWWTLKKLDSKGYGNENLGYHFTKYFLGIYDDNCFNYVWYYTVNSTETHSEDIIM